MYEIQQSATFKKWRTNLKDDKARAAIASRIARLAAGNLGDWKTSGDGVSEMRIDYGPGYRIYYTIRKRILIIVLCGGMKKTQSADIKTARQIAKDWSGEDEGTIHGI